MFAEYNSPTQGSLKNLLLYSNASSFCQSLYSWISQLLRSVVCLLSAIIEIAVTYRNYSVPLWVVTEGIKSWDVFSLPFCFGRSEARQRAGRAGRTSSGTSYRLYSKEFWEQCMPDHTVPEIKRTSLTSVILTLKCLSVHDVIR